MPTVPGMIINNFPLVRLGGTQHLLCSGHFGNPRRDSTINDSLGECPNMFPSLATSIHAEVRIKSKVLKKRE